MIGLLVRATSLRYHSYARHILIILCSTNIKKNKLKLEKETKSTFTNNTVIMICLFDKYPDKELKSSSCLISSLSEYDTNTLETS